MKALNITAKIAWVVSFGGFAASVFSLQDGRIVGGFTVLVVLSYLAMLATSPPSEKT